MEIWLTNREKEVYDLYCKENLNQYQISKRLGIDQSRVSRILKEISKKMGTNLGKKHSKIAKFKLYNLE